MNAADLNCRETAAGLEIRLHVQPRARRNEISGIRNRALKIKITAPPVEDAANHAIVELFSSLLGISRSRLQIASGLKSREKALLVKDLSLRTFLDIIREYVDLPGDGSVHNL